MSLKVLLADDSAAIKKVVQLSLQDYGIILKTVGSGKDVIDVAKSFQPDIALVDVLLPQKTGYEVASELKKDAALKKIPIIMLWSSFMAFDEAKFKSSGAEDNLEKPFEVTGLRALINKYVPRTTSSPVAKHFEFPSLDFDSIKKAPPSAAAPPQAQKTEITLPNIKEPDENWSMSSFEDVPDISKATATDVNTGVGMWNSDSEWVRKDLGKFAVPLPEDNLVAEDDEIALKYTNTNINLNDFLLKPTGPVGHGAPHGAPEVTKISEAKVQEVLEQAEIFITPIPNEPAADQGQESFTTMTAIPRAEPASVAPRPAPGAGAGAGTSNTNTEALAKEIKLQAQEIIERVVWKLVPDIASNLIKEEIKRLRRREMTLTKLVESALAEDIPNGDITTEALECEATHGKATLLARQRLILSGREAFTETFRQIDPKVRLMWPFKDGDQVEKSGTLGEIQGPLSSLLKGERTALNFLGHLSGIATQTARFVEKTAGTNTKITDTRKTIPGLRELEKLAVKHGGGVNHRMGLSDAILVKENHIRTAGSITIAVQKIRNKWPQKPIEVEVTSLEEIDEALRVNVERLLLDNMTLDQMALAVKKVNHRCLIEASGNMTLDRIESVAKLGVDFISVGALTHSAPNADVSLLFNTEIR